jgi:hypothetical protein
MALQCVRHRKKSDTLFRHMHAPLEKVGSEQKTDGSFGNIHTTAIAIQVPFEYDHHNILLHIHVIRVLRKIGSSVKLDVSNPPNTHLIK